jgi:formate/nitrite transporter FocA (FNT family)
MRVVKAIGLGGLIGITALLGVGFIADMAEMDPDVANTLQGVAFCLGFALGVVLAFRDSKPPMGNAGERGD